VKFLEKLKTFNNFPQRPRDDECDNQVWNNEKRATRPPSMCGRE
jgi:hypothetical protein